jgi:hypothetical protein
MVRLATVAVAMALVAVAASASDSFYAAVENRLPSAGGMDLVCRDADASSVRCSWAYAGNYAAGITLLDTRWPEAGECQEPAADGGMCRVVFQDGAVRLDTPRGGARVIGDLPVKRCRRHWLLFSTECTYPDHPHQYAGRRLGNAFQYFAV